MAKDLSSKASTAKTMQSLVTGGNNSVDVWALFEAKVHERRRIRQDDRGVMVWIDKDLKQKLEQLKANGLGYPVRHMVNAAIDVLLDVCKDETSKYFHERKLIY